MGYENLGELVKNPKVGEQYYYVEEPDIALVEVVRFYENEDPNNGYHQDWVGYDLRVVEVIQGEFATDEVFHCGWDSLKWHCEGEFYDVKDATA